MLDGVHPPTVIVDNCPVCGGPPGERIYEGVVDIRQGVGGSWDLVGCRACGAAFAATRLLNEAEGYPASYRQHRAPTSTEGPGAVRSWVREAVLSTYGYRDRAAPTASQRNLGRWLGAVAPVRLRAQWGLLLFPARANGRRILDVGCGNGRFLARMAELGWEVYGIEPDTESARVATEVSGAVVRPSLAEAGFENGWFDVITMNHSIEHVSDPVPTLRSLHGLCQPGGRLGLATPNWSSLMRRVFGPHWHALELPRHLVLYRRQDLERVLEAAGFRAVSVQATSVREGAATWRNSWDLRTRARGSSPPPRPLTSAPVGAAVAALGTVLGLGEELIAWATA